jgi:hypothetical protein
MDDGLTRGVIVFNCGHKCLVRMIVFLRSLRKHYQGPVTVFLEGPHEQNLVDSVRDTFKVDVVYRPVSPSKSHALLRKIEICKDSPYNLSIVLDTDTIVVGDFTELFEAAKGHDLAICHFAGWDSSGGTISRRIKGYAPLKPEYIDAAVKYGPAINCGVFAWRKDTPIFDEWLPIADWGDTVIPDGPNKKDRMYIADEVACQLLLPRYDVNVIGTRCNVSVLHDPNTPDPRIIHFHGKKHCIEAQKCSIWIQEFIETLKENCCGIRKMVIEGQCLEDKRLRRFVFGNEPTMHAELKKQVRSELGMSDSSTCSGFKDNEVTIVTACDKKYVEYLRLTLPNWIKHKHVDRFPMIVYVNGFRRYKRNSELDFLRAYPNIKLIPWEMPEAANQRECMLTAFVLGTAKDVTTPYWVKIDADAFATDDEPLLIPEMKDHVICGHRWGYSFSKDVGPLMDWANNHPAFKDTSKETPDPACIEGRKYWHPGKRVASYVQFHKSDFVRMAASIAGTRLPVPSHDTYLWYVANRLKLPIMQHNFKNRRGMGNKSDLESLKVILTGIDGNAITPVNDDQDVDEEASHD